MPFADDIIERMKKAAEKMIKRGEQRKKVPLNIGDSYLLLSTDNIGIIASQMIEVGGKKFFFGFDKKNF